MADNLNRLSDDELDNVSGGRLFSYTDTKLEKLKEEEAKARENYESKTYPNVLKGMQA